MEASSVNNPSTENGQNQVKINILLYLCNVTFQDSEEFVKTFLDPSRENYIMQKVAALGVKNARFLTIRATKQEYPKIYILVETTSTRREIENIIASVTLFQDPGDTRSQDGVLSVFRARMELVSTFAAGVGVTFKKALAVQASEIIERPVVDLTIENIDGYLFYYNYLHDHYVIEAKKT